MNAEQAIAYWAEFRQEAVDMIAEGEDKGNQLAEQIPMCNIALEALRAQQERENPKPLTLEELRERFGKPVWIDVIGNEEREPSLYAIVGNEWDEGDGIDLHDLINDDGAAYELYGKTWLAYDHEPKEAR